ncbi:MAG: ribosome maturation factor RimP [Desulfobacterales bacterium]
MANEMKIVARVEELLEPLFSAEGMELICVEYQREAGGRTLRLYIDRPGGVTLDDCIYISRQSSDLLDVYLENTGPYRLEVSSPGPNRPLAGKTDFEKFKGNRVQVRTRRPIDGKNRFKGVLLGISEDRVNLSINDQTVTIPHEEIIMARLINKGMP